MNDLYPIIPRPITTQEKMQIKWRMYLNLIAGMPKEAALRKASKQGELAKVKELISEGVNVNGADLKSWTGLHWAAHDGNQEVAHALIDAKADVNAQNRDGHTPLHFAAIFGQTEIADALIAAGANVLYTLERGAHKGDSALKRAAEKGHVDTVSALLAAHASANERDSTGRTALHEAARAGHLETVQLLLDMSADVNAKEFTKGRTPLDLAELEDHSEVVALIKARGGQGEEEVCKIC